MKINKSKHTTIETLSAYLDGQLPETEAENLRQRLAENPSLLSQLEGLRQSRYILKQTPKLKRRRSFVLSPEMVRQQKKVFRAMNVSRFISAAASVLLVAVLGSQYLFTGGMRFASAPMSDAAEIANYQMADEAPVEEPMMMEAAEEMEMMEEAVEEPAAAAPEPSVADDVAEDTAGVVETEPAAPAAEAEEGDGTQDTTNEPGGGGGEPPTEEEDQALGSAAMTATPEGTQRSLPMEKDLDAAAELGEADTVDSLEQELPAELELDIPVEEPVTESQTTPLQVVQGVLLLLAVLGGLAAAYFRKKVR